MAQVTDALTHLVERAGGLQGRAHVGVGWHAVNNWFYVRVSARLQRRRSSWMDIQLILAQELAIAASAAGRIAGAPWLLQPNRLQVELRASATPLGQFRHILRAAAELNPSAVVLLGDLEPRRPLHEELEVIAHKTWFIHGNHDTDSDETWDHVWGSALAGRNIDGRVVELPDGTRLAGLGGVFRESVWYPSLPAEPRYRNRAEHAEATPQHDRWRGGVRRKHWSAIYVDDLNRLADLRADVIVTHEAPGYHRNGFAILDTLALSMGVKVTVHGHHHDWLDSSQRWDQQGFCSFGVGLCGITAIDREGTATVFVPGELDEQRNHRQSYIDTWGDNS